MKLKIAEHFTSIQGEGHLVGKRMFFVRFAGCAVAECPLHPSKSGLCDTDWSPKSLYDSPESVDLLVDLAREKVGAGGWVCVTGGEPLDQEEALKYLCGQLRRNSLKVHIQTSGARRVEVQWDWLTVSPKMPAGSLRHTYGQELKLVYTPGTTMDTLRSYYNGTKFWGYYLQPLWANGDCNMQETISAVHEANDLGMPWSLSIQSHKYMGVR